VKNYDINTNTDGLVNNVSRQVQERAGHLPPGMQQNIRIDVRGQQISQDKSAEVVRRIVENSNGFLRPENIEFRRQ
jgi:filamentous hemagglutinin